MTRRGPGQVPTSIGGDLCPLCNRHVIIKIGRSSYRKRRAELRIHIREEHPDIFPEWERKLRDTR